MKTKKLSQSLFFTLLVILSLACSSLAELSPTATPVPTATFTPTLAPTNTPTPSGPLSATGDPLVVSVGDLALSDELYEHPSGFVSFYPLQGWDIEASDYLVSMVDPETNVGFYITITNTGYELDQDAYATFRSNMEEYYMTDGYQEVSSNSDASIGVYVIEKVYNLENTQMYASSFYQQFDNIILTIEMIGTVDFAQSNSPHIIMYNSFTQTVTVDLDKSSKLPLYQFTWTYQPQDINASLIVPFAWTYQVDETSSLSSAYFFAPDNNAATQFVIVKNTPKYNQQLGFDAVMVWLNATHSNNANDVELFGEVSELEPGLYLFGWTSQASGKFGTMTYDIRIPNKLIMVVTAVDSDFLAIYSDVLGVTADSYILEQ